MAYTPRPFQDLAKSVFREHRREDHVALVSLQRQWAALVGAGLAERTWPSRLQRGLLWVTAPDSSWAYQLQFLKRELLGSLQSSMQDCPVRDLRFKVGTIPALPLPAAATAAAPAPEPEAVSEVVQAASAISDPALRSAFVRAMSKQRARRLGKN